MKNTYHAGGVDWYGCYEGSSIDPLLMVGESVGHPAKMAPKLLARIVDQMMEWGWLKRGDVMVDPFGGTGRTALWWCAKYPENRGITCEIEGHFVEMQRKNLAHAERRLGRELPWDVLRGDSRKLDQLLTGDFSSTRELVAREREKLRARWQDDWSAISFQPLEDYAHAIGEPWAVEYWPDLPATFEEIAGAVMSPPYGQGVIGKGQDPEKLLARCPSLKGRNPNGAWFRALAQGYVNSPGNIDNLPDGDLAGITSPPYADAVNANGHGIDWTKAGPATGNRKRGKGSKQGETFDAHLRYGHTEGQIGALSDRDAVGVTSPPYEGSLASDDPDKRGGLFRDPKRRNDRTLTGSYTSITSPPYEKARESGGIAKNGVERTDGTTRPSDAHVGDHAYCAASITSPPYEAQSGGAGEASRKSVPDPGVNDRCGYRTASNGTNDAQIGTTQGETYAEACAAVYSACARAGIRYLAVVTKDPTRAPTGIKFCSCEDASSPAERPETVIIGGVRYAVCPCCGLPKKPEGSQLRRIGKLTARLLRAAGYRVVAWRRAWLFETEAQLEARGAHTLSLFEELDTPDRPIGRISFFKRLHLAKGRVAAQWEDIFFAVLDAGEGVGVTSPPYAGSEGAVHPSKFKDAAGFAARMAEARAAGEMRGNYASAEAQLRAMEKTQVGYGATPGQIGNLPDREQAVVAITSPPYAGSVATADPDFLTPGEREKKVHSKSNRADYGQAAGQIANLPDRETAEDRLYRRWWELEAIRGQRDLTEAEHSERQRLAAQIDRKRTHWRGR